MGRWNRTRSVFPGHHTDFQEGRGGLLKPSRASRPASCIRSPSGKTGGTAAEMSRVSSVFRDGDWREVPRLEQVPELAHIAPIDLDAIAGHAGRAREGHPLARHPQGRTLPIAVIAGRPSLVSHPDVVVALEPGGGDAGGNAARWDSRGPPAPDCPAAGFRSPGDACGRPWPQRCFPVSRPASFRLWRCSSRNAPRHSAIDRSFHRG